MKIKNEDIKIWSMDEGKISSLKVKNQIINVRPNSPNIDVLNLARRFFETFEVITVVKEISPSTQSLNTTHRTNSRLNGNVLGKMYGISIFDTVIISLREEFKSDSFTILEAGNFLKNKYNFSEANCMKKAQAYTKYLKDNDKLSMLGKTGKQKIFKFNTIKSVLDKDFLKRSVEEERTTRQGV